MQHHGKGESDRRNVWNRDLILLVTRGLGGRVLREHIEWSGFLPLALPRWVGGRKTEGGSRREIEGGFLF